MLRVETVSDSQCVWSWDRSTAITALNRLRQICANAQNFAMLANKMGMDVMASAVQYAVQCA